MAATAPGLVRVPTIEVFFANRHAVMAKNGIGGRQVEEEIRQCVLQQEFISLQTDERIARTAFDDALLGAFELPGLQRQ